LDRPHSTFSPAVAWFLAELTLARAYSKRYFQLFVFKKLNIHHEGNEEHEENKENYVIIPVFFKFLRELRVLRG